MDDQTWNRLKEIYYRAAEQPPEQRANLLDDACAGDETLRAEIEGLLCVHDRGEPGEPGRPEIAEGPDTVVDRYKLLQRIGEGGFGVVYMAEQQEPVHRKVALKIIKLGMGTKQVIARFEAERQALAVMDHPNIAKVLDAGATETGRPYFVMELVKGVAITEYCDQAQLDTAERLELFQDVCHAVQHAHHKGIIHRDLKPSNILVTLLDGHPVPKVIDFGIAKASDHRLTQKTLFTEFGQMIGTPEYMAPEQAELSGLDIDTRADVYALGVVLYELLTGAKPFDLKTLMQRGYDEVLRTIREVEPPKPSTRLSSMGQELGVAARQRHTQPKLLGRLLRGDLDWIVMKALEKERSRRYETADGFAQDVARFLRDEPVLASPPSGMYRLRKYVRRHRIGVAAGLAVLIALGAGLALALAGYVAAGEQRDLARHSESEARTQTVAARNEAKKSAEVARLIEEMFIAADPHEIRGANYTVRQLLDDFDRDLGTRLNAEPEVEAAVREAMGRAYLGLGMPEQAEEHLTKAVEFRRAAFGEESPWFVRSLVYLAEALHFGGKYDQSVKCHRDALAIMRKTLGDEHFRVSRGLTGLANTLHEMGDLDGAERMHRDALTIARKVYGGEHENVASVLSNLAAVRNSQGEFDDAESLLREAIAMQREALGDDHPRLAESLKGLAFVLSASGDQESAEKLLRKALAIQRETLGDAHPLTAVTINNLGKVLGGKGDVAGAEGQFREALTITRKALGNDHPQTAVCLTNLATMLYRKGEFDAAEGHYRDALRITRKSWGDRHGNVGRILHGLAETYKAKGALERSAKHYREALAIYRRSGPPSSVATCLYNLGVVQFLKQDHASAETTLREALGVRRTDMTLGLLGLCLLRQGKLADAEPLLRECLAIRAKRMPGTWGHYSAMSLLGGALAGQGKYEEAETLLVEGYTKMVPPQHLAIRKREALERVIELYRAWGKPEKASQFAALGATPQK